MNDVTMGTGVDAPQTVSPMSVAVVGAKHPHVTISPETEMRPILTVVAQIAKPAPKVKDVSRPLTAWTRSVEAIEDVRLQPVTMGFRMGRKCSSTAGAGCVMAAPTARPVIGITIATVGIAIGPMTAVAIHGWVSPVLRTMGTIGPFL